MTESRGRGGRAFSPSSLCHCYNLAARDRMRGAEDNENNAQWEISINDSGKQLCPPPLRALKAAGEAQSHEPRASKSAKRAGMRSADRTCCIALNAISKEFFYGSSHKKRKTLLNVESSSAFFIHFLWRNMNEYEANTFAPPTLQIALISNILRYAWAITVHKSGESQTTTACQWVLGGGKKKASGLDSVWETGKTMIWRWGGFAPSSSPRHHRPNHCENWIYEAARREGEEKEAEFHMQSRPLSAAEKVFSTQISHFMLRVSIYEKLMTKHRIGVDGMCAFIRFHCQSFFPSWELFCGCSKFVHSSWSVDATHD